MRRTLLAIRQSVPEADRHEPALAPSNLPQWATARDGSRYVAVSIYPRTIDELRQLCREYGEAAVCDLHWSCVVIWLMNAPDKADLSNPFAVASVAVGMIWERDRTRLAWPRHDGEEWNPPALNFLSPDVRDEAELVAAETLSDWERAGKPYMGRDRIRCTYQHLIGSPDFQKKYVRPLDDNKE